MKLPHSPNQRTVVSPPHPNTPISLHRTPFYIAGYSPFSKNNEQTKISTRTDTKETKTNTQQKPRMARTTIFAG